MPLSLDRMKASVQKIADRYFPSTGTVTRNGVQVLTGVPFRVSFTTAFASGSDLSPSKAGIYILSTSVTVDLRHGDRVAIDGYTYEVVGPLHHVSFRAQKQYEAELQTAPGQATP